MSGQLAREPQRAHGVGAVGRHLDVEHHIGEWEQRREVRAEGRVIFEHQDALVVGSQAQLPERADHPGRVDAADAALVDTERVAIRISQRRPGWRERDHCAHVEVPGSAYHLDFAGARVDASQPDLVGIGMGPQPDDLAHDDARERRLYPFDRLDGEPEIVERDADLVRIAGRQVGEVA